MNPSTPHMWGAFFIIHETFACHHLSLALLYSKNVAPAPLTATGQYTHRSKRTETTVNYIKNVNILNILTILPLFARGRATQNPPKQDVHPVILEHLVDHLPPPSSNTF